MAVISTSSTEKKPYLLQGGEVWLSSFFVANTLHCLRSLLFQWAISDTFFTLPSNIKSTTGPHKRAWITQDFLLTQEEALHSLRDVCPDSSQCYNAIAKCWDQHPLWWHKVSPGVSFDHYRVAQTALKMPLMVMKAPLSHSWHGNLIGFSRFQRQAKPPRPPGWSPTQILTRAHATLVLETELVWSRLQANSLFFVFELK